MSSYKSKLVVLLILVTSLSAHAQIMGTEAPKPVAPPPNIINQVGIEQNLNTQLPLNLTFIDETGKAVKLADYFSQKPVILSLVYYECPMLCTETLNGMVSAFGVLKFDVGKEFNVVTVSFDPREKPPLAAAKKAKYLKRYGRPGAEQGWHFLTGDDASIKALTNAFGFHYAWDAPSQQFAHAAGIVVATPQGRIAQYFYGVEFSPKDLRFGLIQASQNQIGTLVDQVLLYCYHYDPRTGRYGPIVARVMAIAGVGTIVILGGFLILMFRLEPKQPLPQPRRARAGGQR